MFAERKIRKGTLSDGGDGGVQLMTTTFVDSGELEDSGTFPIAYNETAGENRIVMVILMKSDDASVCNPSSVVSFDGATGRRVSDWRVSHDDDVLLEYFYWIDVNLPSTDGLKNIVVSSPGGTSYLTGAYLLQFENVNQTTPFFREVDLSYRAGITEPVTMQLDNPANGGGRYTLVCGYYADAASSEADLGSDNWTMDAAFTKDSEDQYWVTSAVHGHSSFVAHADSAVASDNFWFTAERSNYTSNPIDSLIMSFIQIVPPDHVATAIGTIASNADGVKLHDIQTVEWWGGNNNNSHTSYGFPWGDPDYETSAVSNPALIVAQVVGHVTYTQRTAFNATLKLNGVMADNETTWLYGGTLSGTNDMIGIRFSAWVSGNIPTYGSVPMFSLNDSNCPDLGIFTMFLMSGVNQTTPITSDDTESVARNEASPYTSTLVTAASSDFILAAYGLYDAATGGTGLALDSTLTEAYNQKNTFLMPDGHILATAYDADSANTDTLDGSVFTWGTTISAMAAEVISVNPV